MTSKNSFVWDENIIDSLTDGYLRMLDDTIYLKPIRQMISKYLKGLFINDHIHNNEYVNILYLNNGMQTINYLDVNQMKWKKKDVNNHNKSSLIFIQPMFNDMFKHNDTNTIYIRIKLHSNHCSFRSTNGNDWSLACGIVGFARKENNKNNDQVCNTFVYIYHMRKDKNQSIFTFDFSKIVGMKQLQQRMAKIHRMYMRINTTKNCICVSINKKYP